ncbi:MAG: hypothetical protein QOE63_1432 [Acidimicrobiaceae bacterium]
MIVGDDGEHRPDELADADLSGAVFRNVNLRGAKMVDVVLTNADLSGLIDGLRVNGVEVAPLVEAELRRLHPDREALLADDPAGLQRAWATVEQLWAGTIQRAQQLPEHKLHERVDGEWSLIETLRHLLFVTDAWISRVALGEREPFHPWGLPPSFVVDAASYGIDLAAAPTFDDIVAARNERTNGVRALLDGITEADLDRRCVPPDVAGYPPVAEHRLRDCIWTVLDEEWWHNQFANRDLDALLPD